MMDIRVEFDAKAALRTIGEIGRSKTAEAVRRGLLESCRLVQSEARSRHQFTSRTGVLERSIEYRLERGSLVGVVKISDAAPYGVFVHEPTGIYGPTKERYQIRPKRKQALRWAADGKLHFARLVNHPGSPADRFLYEAADRSRERIRKIFARHIQKAIQSGKGG